mmetsp:Transcript_67398/g.171061  ORF Transcript_67398/g.171061 Transcript_67398/m.171061 type:complete len:517 (+) Transcript_67398:145-1695(+)|eukprot:CAMPEP_0183519192 /NCGR_PEP_ID=MMETSP0371-20130417/15906_1 /TAXON_ID=268820 /ORGANISM="Peridinium aciculiferum, Strain PAER-2" /LENGTH=516 /DNA_ID=CAMNT_0025717283 /DNA_START=38 /DNA_END=1588 /DNA_ORIENTATION=+
MSYVSRGRSPSPGGWPGGGPGFAPSSRGASPVGSRTPRGGSVGPYGQLTPGEAMGQPFTGQQTVTPRQRNRNRDWIPHTVVSGAIRLGGTTGLVLFCYGLYLLATPGGGSSRTGGGAVSSDGAGASEGSAVPVPVTPGLRPPAADPTGPPMLTTPIPPYSGSAAPGTTEMIIINNEFSDGVVFCRGPVEGSLNKVYLDQALSKPVVKSEFDCALPDSPAAKQWGVGVPGGSTLAFGLRRGERATMYIAPDGGWPSGACWYQDAASNARVSIAKGPMYMSEVEFTIEASGKGAVWYDMSSVEGVSGGITMNYTDDAGNMQTDVAVPAKFQGTTLQVVLAPGIGFPTVLSDKNRLGSCTCNEWDIDSPECNSDACFAGCPGSLVDNPCGQHRCRKFYAKLYQDSSSYCGWLYAAKAQTYCWAMDEWQCFDATCGYGGAGQPEADCSSKYPKGAAANSYSCGRGMNMPGGKEGELWWSNGAGCKDKMVNGVPTNPSPRRSGGRIQISFENLPWLHEALR